MTDAPGARATPRLIIEATDAPPSSQFEKSVGWPGTLCCSRVWLLAAARGGTCACCSDAGTAAAIADMAAVGERRAAGDCGSMATVRIPQSLLCDGDEASSGRATHTSPRPVTISSSTYDLAPHPPAAATEPIAAAGGDPPVRARPEDTRACGRMDADAAAGDSGAIPGEARIAGDATAARAPPDHKPSSTSTCSGLRGIQAPIALAPRPRELRCVRSSIASTPRAPCCWATSSGVRPLKSLSCASAPALTSASARRALLSTSLA
mmetsp:Transcript_13610/g.21554  ORF Transcript_13610/g.21554 Transcript_13610/m.21554 type:complete len:265 (-) Transcript_13610:2360-3154(-)